MRIKVTKKMAREIAKELHDRKTNVKEVRLTSLSEDMYRYYMSATSVAIAKRNGDFNPKTALFNVIQIYYTHSRGASTIYLSTFILATISEMHELQTDKTFLELLCDYIQSVLLVVNNNLKYYNTLT